MFKISRWNGKLQLMEIIQAPDPRLRIKTKPVKKITPYLVSLTKKMIKLVKTFIDPEGVGLASTQIGETEQFFIAKLNGEIFRTVFNPQILTFGKGYRVFFEGCLSTPNYYGEIKRPTTIKVSYIDPSGKEITEFLKGLSAWIFQHEYDHLHGKLMIDRVLEQKSRLFKVVGKDRAGADIFEEIKL